MLLTGATVGVARAQAPDLVTDRPDQTESAVVIPRGLAQVETGYRFASDDGSGRHEAPGTLVRVGLGARTELRVGYDGVVWSEGRHGGGDGELGAKVNLVSHAGGWQTQVAVLGGISLPMGAASYSSGAADPSFLLSIAHTLSPRVSLGYNVGEAWASSPDAPRRDASIPYSASLGLGLADRVGGFLELYGDAGGAAGSHVSIDAGLTHLLTGVVQLDVSGGRRLSGAAKDFFVGGGLSIRLPR